jgi:hypothetical protein
MYPEYFWLIFSKNLQQRCSWDSGIPATIAPSRFRDFFICPTCFFFARAPGRDDAHSAPRETRWRAHIVFYLSGGSNSARRTVVAHGPGTAMDASLGRSRPGPEVVWPGFGDRRVRILLRSPENRAPIRPTTRLGVRRTRPPHKE